MVALPNELLHMILGYVLTEYIDEVLTLATCDRDAFDTAVLPSNAFLALLHVSRKFREITADLTYVILGIGREPGGGLAENPNTVIKYQRKTAYNARHGIISDIADNHRSFEPPTPLLRAYRILGDVECCLQDLISSAEPADRLVSSSVPLSVHARCLGCSRQVRSDVLSERIRERAGKLWVRFVLIHYLKKLAYRVELNRALNLLSVIEVLPDQDISAEDQLGILLASTRDSTVEFIDSYLDRLASLEDRLSSSAMKAAKMFGLRSEDMKITRDIVEHSGTISFLEKILDTDALIDKSDIGVRAHALL